MAIAATGCAPAPGVLVGRVTPRLPLLLAGGLIAAGGLCSAGPIQNSDLALLAVAFLLIEAGFGFANAPMTKTAVSGLPASRAGVAGASPPLPAALSSPGIAIAGGIVTGASDARLAHATRPGWLVIAACGLLVLIIAGASPGVSKARAIKS